jgi:radical SAM superfamily enzyme YgiQ (UPF0313 family)
MKIERVLLINAANDTGHSNVANYAIFPPLNILSIGSTVKQVFKEIDVYLYDGQMHNVNDINTWIRSLKPNVVGISVLSSSYRNSIAHAKAAKDVGAVTILGNDHAAVYGKQILQGKNGKYVDYICTADIGEIVFCDFLRYLQGEKTKSNVPKLMYLSQGNGDPVCNPGEELTKKGKWLLDQIPIVNWGLIRNEMLKYKCNYQRVYGGLLGDTAKDCTAVTINRARGCHRFGNSCLYCGIMDLHPKFSSPTVFWNEVKAANDALGANIFYEACDSIGGFLPYVRELVKQRPKNLKDIKFFVYSEALTVTPELLKLYRKLPVFMVNMGLDSGDDKMLRRLKSGKDSVKMNENAVKLLRKSGIYIYASFVLGAPGETEKSLKNTIKFARSLMKDRQLAAIEVQPLYPLFNAKAGEWLMNVDKAKWDAEIMRFKIRNLQKLSEMRDKYGNDDNPDPKEISKDWIDIFCNVSYEDLQEAALQIKDDAVKFDIECGAAW